jgi:hypothetical protein
VAAAEKSLRRLIAQLEETPNGRAQIIDSDDTEPMTIIVGLLGDRRGTEFAPACSGIERAAAKASSQH